MQHQTRTFNFGPIMAKAAANVLGATPSGQEALDRDRNGHGKHSYNTEFPKAIHAAMSPGAELDAINRASVQLVTASLDKLAKEVPKTTKLFEWSRNEIALATSDAVYGPENPLQDPGLLNCFWRLDPGIMPLLLQIAPSILAKDTIAAREELVAGFRRYFAVSGHERGSALVRARHQHNVDYDIGPEDMARFEVGGAIAVLTNTVPTAFWMLYRIVSSPAALSACRQELESVCTINGEEAKIDITDVKQKCPLLLSSLQETLRVHGTGISVRVVQEDHLLDGQYLLKKGGLLMIPGPVLHTSPAVYGKTVGEFDHARFVRAPGKPRPNPAGFRGFGGGAMLCPGRHFVSTEILAFVALAILRFDFAPQAGEWVCPTTEKAGMQAATPPPDEDVDVTITLRTEGEWASKKWVAVVKDSDKALDM